MGFMKISSDESASTSPPSITAKARPEPKPRLPRAVRIGLPTIVLLLALWLLYRALRHYSARDVISALLALSWTRIGLAAACTVLAYLVLVGYDWLGLRHIGHSLALRKIASAAFISYALSYNLGSPIIMGTSVRYRLYSAWGLATRDIAKVVVFCIATFWVGLVAIAGVIFVREPAAISKALHLPQAYILPLGVVLVVVVMGYLAWSAMQGQPLRIRGWELAPPALWISIAQIAITVVDLVLAGTVLYILLPGDLGLSYLGMIGVYLVAVILGLASQIPGGLGVFETAFLHLLPTNISPAAVAGALIAYRGMFYLFPLLIALILLGGHELRIRLARRGRRR